MAKKKSKKQDWEIIDTPYGQWEYPGAITRIPSNDITMQGVPYPVLGVSDTNDIQMMYPNQDYQFDGSSVTEYPLPEAGSGYKVVRSSERKGKTHKVTGPDGTVKFFGDSKLGQHPKDPARKKAFYARHKKNLAGNPYFRAFARKTWEEGGELNDWEILDTAQDGGSNWEILPEAQVGTQMGIISDPRKDAYYTQLANSNQNIQQEILKQESANYKGSKSNPVSLPEVEIVAKKQLDPSKKAFGTVYPDKTGSSAKLASALFLTPITEWAHTPSRVVNYGIGAYKNKDLTFNPYQSEITETLDLKTDPNNLWHSVRNFAINNAADFVAPMTPKLGNWSKELVKGSIKAGRPKLPEFQTVLRAEASGFNPSKVSPSPSLNPVQQGYTGQWLQTASKKNPGAFDEVAAYLTGLETKSGGKMQLLSDVVPWSEAQKFTGKNLPFDAKTMSFGAGEFGTLENAFKQGVITKRELALLQNYNSQAARIGSSPNLNKAMNETISKLRQNPKTYNANEMLNASLASRLRLAPTSVGSPELLSKELEAIKNQAMKGYLYAPAVEAAKKGITKKTVLEQVKPEDEAQSGGRINSEWEIMQEGGNYRQNLNELENKMMRTPQNLSYSLADRILRGANISLGGGHNDNIDALRHSGTAMYSTSAQGPLLAPFKIPYTNLLGLAHEAKVFADTYSNPNRKKTWTDFKQDLKETGSDLYNNFIGSTIGGLPISLDTKEKLLKKAHNNNLLSILEPSLSPEKQEQQSFFERKEMEKNFKEQQLNKAQNSALRNKFKQVQTPPEMAFGGNLILEKYDNGGNVWEILPDSEWEII